MREYPPMTNVQPPPGWTTDMLLDYVSKVLDHLDMTHRAPGYKSYAAMDAWRLLDQILRQEPYDHEVLGLIGGRGHTIPQNGAFHRWLTHTFHPEHPLWMWMPHTHRPTRQ